MIEDCTGIKPAIYSLTPFIQQLELLGYQDDDLVVMKFIPPNKDKKKHRKDRKKINPEVFKAIPGCQGTAKNGKPAEAIHYFYPSKNNFPTLKQLKNNIKNLTIHPQTNSYFVVNGQGRKAENIHVGRAFILECDNLPKDKQWELLQQLKFPGPTFTVETPNSLHFYYVYSEPIPIKQWESLQERFLNCVHDMDQSIKDAPRPLRIAGVHCAYYDQDIDQVKNDITTKLIPGSLTRYSVEQITKLIEVLEVQQTEILQQYEHEFKDQEVQFNSLKETNYQISKEFLTKLENLPKAEIQAILESPEIGDNRKDDEFRCVCPFHGDNPTTLHATKKSHGWVFYCHASCGLCTNVQGFFKRKYQINGVLKGKEYYDFLKRISADTGIPLVLQEVKPNQVNQSKLVADIDTNKTQKEEDEPLKAENLYNAENLSKNFKIPESPYLTNILDYLNISDNLRTFILQKSSKWSQPAYLDIFALAPFIGSLTNIHTSFFFDDDIAPTKNIFFIVFVAHSGVGKSPYIGFYTQVLSAMNIKAEEDFREAMKDYHRQLKQYEARQKKNPQTCEEEPELPAKKVYYGSEFSVEALKETHRNDRQHGLLGIYNEMPDIKKNLSGTDTGGMEGTFIELFDGNTISKQTLKSSKEYGHTFKTAFNIITTYQFDALQKDLTKMLTSTNNGYYPRFLYMFMNYSKEDLSRLGQRGNRKKNIAYLRTMFEYAYSLDPIELEINPREEKETLNLIRDFKRWKESEISKWNVKLPAVASLPNKYETYMFRLAVFFHNLEAISRFEKPHPHIPVRLFKLAIEVVKALFWQLSALFINEDRKNDDDPLTSKVKNFLTKYQGEVLTRRIIQQKLVTHRTTEQTVTEIFTTLLADLLQKGFITPYEANSKGSPKNYFITGIPNKENNLSNPTKQKDQDIPAVNPTLESALEIQNINQVVEDSNRTQEVNFYKEKELKTHTSFYETSNQVKNIKDDKPQKTTLQTIVNTEKQQQTILEILEAKEAAKELRNLKILAMVAHPDNNGYSTLPEITRCTIDTTTTFYGRKGYWVTYDNNQTNSTERITVKLEDITQIIE